MSAPIILIPDNPMPMGGHAFWLELREGLRLRALRWPDGPAGTVFLFNGRTEFAEKYFEVVGELRMRGFAVTTLDWRGQGLSDRLLADVRKGHVADFADYERDLDAFMATAKHFPRPWIALAHSMGGHILLRAAHDRQGLFDAMVLTAPMQGLLLGGALGTSALRVFASTLVRLGLGPRYVPGGTGRAADNVPFAGNIITSDEGRYRLHVALIQAEPRLGLGAPTLGWLDAAFRSMSLTSDSAYLSAIETPVLIAAAGHERLVDNVSIAYAARLLPEAMLTQIAGAEHEILMERDACRRAFWLAFDEFAARLG